MPTYTVLDTATDKKVTFEWNDSKPPNDTDMIEVFAKARESEVAPETPEVPGDRISPTIKEGMPSAVPSLETAANLATSAYGIPLSGLAGLFALPFGLDKAKGVVEGVQKALVYQPQTKGGQELTETATYPIQKLDQLGGYVGGKLEEAGHPDLGAAAHSGIVGAPAVVAGAKMALKPSSAKAMAKLDTEMNKAIDTGVNKAVRPSVIKKETHSQVVRYRNQARTAIREIVDNKDNLNIVDATGVKVEGLPKTLDQFSQAIEQTKRVIFEEYDALAKRTGKVGVKVNLDFIAKELEPVIKNKTLRDLSPETIEYAQGRIDVLTERGFYTAVETQEAIQLLNQTLKQFYKDPSPAMKGKALVDSLIANNLRKNLDSSIRNATGKNYQALKNKYGALRTLESDVTKRSIVDARKNIKGLLDFSDVFSGYHIVRGVLSADPATVVAGGVSKTIAAMWKWRNDPNRIVKNMFGDVEKLIGKQNVMKQ